MAVAGAVTTQGRVLWALILREVRTLYGDSKIGYLWAIIKTAFGLGVFWALRSFTGAHPPHGMSVPVFLLAGFFVWNIFSTIIAKCLAAIDGNKALLTFPQVTQLDLMISRAVVVMATETVSALVLLSAGILLGLNIQISDWVSVLAILFLAPAWALAAGIFVASLTIFWPPLGHLVPMALRILFFLSGVFFSPNMFAKKVGDFLLLNPVLQFVEWLRQSMSSGYVAPDLDVIYLLSLTIIVLCIGLLIERYARTRKTQ